MSLTPQQAEVARLVSEGLLNKQIAHALGITEATVKAHVSACLAALGVGNRVSLAIVVFAERAPAEQRAVLARMRA